VLAACRDRFEGAETQARPLCSPACRNNKRATTPAAGPAQVPSFQCGLSKAGIFVDPGGRHGCYEGLRHHVAQGPGPKPEIRGPKEGRIPRAERGPESDDRMHSRHRADRLKRELRTPRLARVFGFRISALFRPSEFGPRPSRSGPLPALGPWPGCSQILLALRPGLLHHPR
jgi:hypothetical protein